MYEQDIIISAVVARARNSGNRVEKGERNSVANATIMREVCPYTFDIHIKTVYDINDTL